MLLEEEKGRSSGAERLELPLLREGLDASYNVEDWELYDAESGGG